MSWRVWLRANCSMMTNRPFWRGALRQLVLGGVAAGLTYLIGLAVGGLAAA